MSAGYRSPLLDRPGAVAAAGADAGVAAHYGDPMREQRVPGPVDLSHRGVVKVSGPDRLSWLHSLTTQHVEHLGPGSSTEALVLSPQGHIEHALYAVDDGTSFWAHVEPGTAPALVAFLDSMRFLLRVEVADLTGEFAVIWEPDTERHGSYLSKVSDRGREVFIPRRSLAGWRSAARGASSPTRISASRISPTIRRRPSTRSSAPTARCRATPARTRAGRSG